jgi:hypothetical protein
VLLLHRLAGCPSRTLKSSDVIEHFTLGLQPIEESWIAQSSKINVICSLADPLFQHGIRCILWVVGGASW